MTINDELTKLFLKIVSKNWAGVTNPYDGFDDAELNQMQTLCACGLIRFTGDETCTWVAFTEKGHDFGASHNVSTRTTRTARITR
jgi:hypothetical protein